MWNNLRIFQANLFRLSEQFFQTKRTVYILKRKNTVKLSRFGFGPKKLKKRQLVYELLEDTNYKPSPPVELVLTANVPGVGMRGEKLVMNPFTAYKDLLLPKLALYSHLPEAKSIVKTTEEKACSSIYTRALQNHLADQAVKIILSNDAQWTLKPWHVKFALRKNGIMANEECIKVPKEISGPDPSIENRDFIVYLTMNKTEVFPVRCRIYHWSTTDPMFNQKSFDVDSISEPLFQDEKEMIDSLINAQQEVRRNKMIKGERNVKRAKKK